LRASLNLILSSIIGSENISETEQLKVDYDVSMLLSSWDTFQRNTNPTQHNISNFRHFLALNSIPENENGLTLSTIHAAKGLEYEIVLVMGMNEGVLPYYKASSESELETEKNTAYVAITRAKKCLYITIPKSRLMPWGSSKAQYISRFIDGYKTNMVQV
jgi:DNA helicase-2/ATP-dependent DNA helicase PcrA